MTGRPRKKKNAGTNAETKTPANPIQKKTETKKTSRTKTRTPAEARSETGASAAKTTPPAVGKKPAGVIQIVRMNRESWWCPQCDHSASLEITFCKGCGLRREGDKMTINM